MYYKTGSSELVGIAFEAAERGRGRALLDLMSAGRSRSELDPILLDREQKLRELLNSKAQEQLRLQEAGHRDQAVKDLAVEVRDLAFQYEKIEGDIQDQLMGPRLESHPLSYKEIEDQLDDSTIMLEYSLGEFRSYFWLLQKDSISVYGLPTQSQIEQKVRPILSYLEAGPSASITKERLFSRNASELSQILFGAVEQFIREKRLVIVPDGSLTNLPFGVLPSPLSSTNGAAQSALATDHEIVKGSSASVLTALRTRRNKKVPASKSIIVFADPVFGRYDPRVQKDIPALDGQLSAIEQVTLTRGLLYSGDRKVSVLPRLPATRAEAEVIRELAAPDEVEIRLGFDVNRAAVINKGLNDYRIIHFATHAIANMQTPELSGIVLSLVAENGDWQDGYLRLADIEGLKLDADLVVLSACNTNTGKNLKGEGLASLSYGFLESGADTVLASSWKIDDEATGQLMRQFYYNLLQLKESPARALRAAKSWMVGQEQWRAPYNWAGFEIEGDWR
jgi:CHAT domain-containing protein